MKKIGLVCLAVVLAMGALGVSYALWSDSLYLDGTVETGVVDVSIVRIASGDPFGGIDYGYDKDVAWTEAFINPGGNSATVIVHNG